MKTEQIAAAFGGLWAIDRAGLDRRIAEIALLAEARIQVTSKTASSARNVDKVAVIPLHGVIQQRGNWLSEMFGDTSLESFGVMFDAAMNDPKVKSILLHVDSPGGSVYGVPETAAKVYNARGTKPIIALANSMAASAAYYVASAADRFYVTPSSESGSIGVYSLHVDESEALAKEGVKVTITKAGKYKAEGNPFEPLSKDAAEYEQKQVDAIYTEFVNDVAKHRGTTVTKVKADFGQGRTVQSRDAVATGMADKVATLEQVISRMAANRIKTDGPAASDDWSEFTDKRRDSISRKRIFDLRRK